ncbi:MULTISPECIES: hypothetical protein [unclassified Nonomuraea]|uniref:hypothetical protein n=1 Tax=unclassified Nonomuraea TaxID=2593643 RepID=UPI0033CCB279
MLTGARVVAGAGLVLALSAVLGAYAAFATWRALRRRAAPGPPAPPGSGIIAG